MPSLIDLRRRIRAVKSTQQITKAMKMIAASRLRKSQERVVNARPFAIQALRVLRDLAARTDASSHPLLAVARGEDGSSSFVLTADKGLCGSFNTNIIKAAVQSIARQARAAGRAGAHRPQGPRLLPPPRVPGRLRGASTSSST